jgi:hypothetical protein
MESLHIKLIVAQEFSSKGENHLAQAARELDDNIIDKMLGGHPYIAKLFVDASLEMGMKEIINDPEF